ncbi:MAG: alkaline phosphatase family protein [Xanthomonadales bacterium]|nr:alkaline phosphatase family protein [Xanthomonadales bacterium]
MHSANCRSICLITVLLACLLSACGSEPPAERRIIVLGFDGMDPVLVQERMARGDLPNLARLAETGHFQSLATSNPPQSPVAWASFATGAGAGSHGIYDFLRRDPETYAPVFSISKTVPGRSIELFGTELPLSDAQIVNRRIGEPFWSTFEDRGERATVLRVPVTFPPDPVHRMFSGMGIPDLLGTQGTYTLYATRRQGSALSSSTRTVRMRPYRDGRIETRIEGPTDPFGDGASLEVPLTLEPQGAAVVVQTGDWQQRLEAGDWSDWVRLEFDILGPLGVTGIVRFHLVQGYPDPVLYMSPIHIDPQDPAVPLTHPESYAGELADRIGLYHTIGMPEETWSLNEGHISGEAFLEMEKTILAEREAMFFDALERADSELVMGVFVQTDRVSHMFYRGLDPDHPLYPETSEVERQAIDWIYREADRIVGRTLNAMGPDDRLIIISDHGFAPFRRAVHLNNWLRRAGFLVLKEGAAESGPLFSDVDWSRTRAYAIGLNGIFLNLAGREAEGIVDPKDAARLKAELAARLAEFRDPDLDQPVISRVFDGAEIYPGNANDDAPDLVAGYQRGYRASWQTSLGAVPPRLIEDNDRAWSGDHCIDPALVPGVFFSSHPLNETVSGIGDIAGLILSLQ